MTDRLPDIVVNGRFLTQKLTGVQRFAVEVTRELAKLTPLTIVIPKGTSVDSISTEATIVEHGELSGHLWEQVSLPGYLRRAGSPLLLNLASTGPVVYRNQISTHHDITYVRHPESFSWKFRLLYSLMIPPLLRRSRRVITVSEFSREEISSHYRIDPGKIDVVPNGISDVFQPSGERYPSEAPYLLAVSSPNRHKNFDALVRAFEAASTSTMRELIIVGTQDAAFSRGGAATSTRTRFVGRVDDDDLARLYRGAHAFAFPSLYEGFGIPPLEAQRSGAPVIASNTASMPDVLRDSVVYFDPSNEAEIRAAIERIDDDEALRRELIARGFDNAQRFSWQASARLVAQTIDAAARAPL